MPFRSEKPFSAALLHAAGGELTARVVSNSLTRSPLALEYQIAVEFEPFQFAAEAQNAALNLYAIPLDARSWRQLAGRAYAFDAGMPAAQIADGESDAFGSLVRGRIRLLGDYMPAYCSRIAFGDIENGGIGTELDVLLDLEKIGTPLSRMSFQTRLRLGGVQIVGDQALLKRPAPDQAHDIAVQFLDIGEYELQNGDALPTYQPKLK